MNRLYRFKKRMLAPYAWYMRRRHACAEPFIAKAMELHYYRPAFMAFIAASAAKPDLLTDIPLKPGDVVLDVGAYDGSWAAQIASRYQARVLAFEPNPRNFRQLATLAASQPGIEAYDFGLGARDEKLPILLKGEGSSIYSHRDSDIGVDSTECQIKAAATVWQALELDRVALVKINIEGAEFPLLQHMLDENLLSRIDCLMVQFHEWHPGAYGKRRRLQRALRQTHELAWDYPFVWEKWNRKQP